MFVKPCFEISILAFWLPLQWNFKVTPDHERVASINCSCAVHRHEYKQWLNTAGAKNFLNKQYVQLTTKQAIFVR